MGEFTRFYLAKAPNESFVEAIMKESAKKPGVGRYDIAMNSYKKIIGNYKNNSPKSGMHEEAVFRGMSTPSHYPIVDFDKYRPRILATKIPKPKDKPQ